MTKGHRIQTNETDKDGQPMKVLLETHKWKHSRSDEGLGLKPNSGDFQSLTKFLLRRTLPCCLRRPSSLPWRIW